MTAGDQVAAAMELDNVESGSMQAVDHFLLNSKTLLIAQTSLICTSSLANKVREFDAYGERQKKVDFLNFLK